MRLAETPIAERTWRTPSLTIPNRTWLTQSSFAPISAMRAKTSRLSPRRSTSVLREWRV